MIAFDERAALVLGDRGEVLFDGDPAAHLRFEDRDGRLTIVELTVQAERVTGRVINQIPLGRIEEAVNQAEVAAQVRSRIAYRPPWATLGGLEPARDVPLILGRDRPAPHPVQPEALVRPVGRNLPDDFYAQVARVYAQHAAMGPRPAVAIAESAGESVSTVHRWVKEARRRGLMAPSSRRRSSTRGEES